MPAARRGRYRVQPSRATRLERANPGNRLAAESVDERIVLDSEGNVLSRFGKHDASPAAHAEKRLRVERPFRESLGRSPQMIRRLIDVAQRDDIHVGTACHIREITPTFAARSDRRDAVAARESESTLNLRMQAVEIIAERALID